jgi:YidC/Oxa1 family membrane protein insertase
MWAAFVEMLFQILQQIYYFVGDWGLAIIVFTILIRLLLTPLMVKQTRSMHDMQKIQPLVKQLQEEYKDDTETLNQKTMELYSEHKVNPMASCLPMILQMPLLIAFYQMLANEMTKDGVVTRAGGPLFQYLNSAAAASGEGSFYRLIPNLMLTARDVFDGGKGFAATIPYFILLALFAVSIYVPQLITSQSAGEEQQQQQKMMGAAMAVMMLFLGWGVPAGVLLYWDTSSLIGIAQQWLTQRALKGAMEESDELALVETGPMKTTKKRPTKKDKRN